MSNLTNKMQENFSELMAKAQSGDQKAYKKLLVSITPILKSFLYKRVFDKDRIDDILQDILIGIHKARHTYRPEQPFENWMFGIARHKMIDAIRKQTRKDGREFATDKYEFLNVTDPASATNDKEQDVSEDLKRALETLPERQKDLVVRTKIEGHSIADVAQEFDMSESAVKVSIHRSLKKLQSWMIENGYA